MTQALTQALQWALRFARTVLSLVLSFSPPAFFSMNECVKISYLDERSSSGETQTLAVECFHIQFKFTEPMIPTFKRSHIHTHIFNSQDHNRRNAVAMANQQGRASEGRAKKERRKSFECTPLTINETGE